MEGWLHFLPSSRIIRGILGPCFAFREIITRIRVAVPAFISEPSTDHLALSFGWLNSPSSLHQYRSSYFILIVSLGNHLVFARWDTARLTSPMLFACESLAMASTPQNPDASRWGYNHCNAGLTNHPHCPRPRSPPRVQPNMTSMLSIPNATLHPASRASVYPSRSGAGAPKGDMQNVPIPAGLARKQRQGL
ncbi:hypothetical protein ACRALDRAFT_209695 [Sodiomyces alcalophilus JCM 7366]|uniref:uncharacterized protein n=1 Tax=Sodiomyces alcalophilus JCM 7366 TaxID=591952 RepID=UPI0039B470A0